jgi:hypothetical protein
MAKAASERIRPGCDQAHSTVAATIGPTPRRSSSSRVPGLDDGQDRLLVAAGFCRELHSATGEVAQHGRGGAGLEIPSGLEAKPRGAAYHRERAFVPESGAQLLGGGDDESEDLLLSDRRCLDRGAPGGEQHRECLPLTGRPRCADPGARERFARADGIQRVRLGAVAALGSFRPVQLDDELVDACEVAGEAGAVTAGSLDRPGPGVRMLVGELHQGLVTLSCRLHGDLGEHPAGSYVKRRGAVGRDVGFDADDHVNDPRRRRSRWAWLSRARRWSSRSARN